MSYSARYQELAAELTDRQAKEISPSGICVNYLPFQSSTPQEEDEVKASLFLNERVHENQQFDYPVFYNRKKPVQDEAIILLHGLNERSWNKYYTWAEALCERTGKAVILFPIAYHVNRSPAAWLDPRELSPLLQQRKLRNGYDRLLSVANVTLSERLSEQPIRFFTSGLQTYKDLVKLYTEISDGRIPFFKENCRIDVFAYSIGAFLAQILFLSEETLFSASRLFMFCGGSIFSAMYGGSRSIMDSTSYHKLYDYYLKDFSLEEAGRITGTKLARIFHSMIAPFHLTDYRLQLFQAMSDRIGGVSLQRDSVIPYSGVQEAMGNELAGKLVQLLDFPYGYCHENPFPIVKENTEEVDRAFSKIFNLASGFLAC